MKFQALYERTTEIDTQEHFEWTGWFVQVLKSKITKISRFSGATFKFQAFSGSSGPVATL